LKDIHEDDWISSQRKYACGFTELDGEMLLTAPQAPTIQFEEYDLTFQPKIIGGGYTIYITPKIRKTGMIEVKTSFGMTKKPSKTSRRITIEILLYVTNWHPASPLALSLIDTRSRQLILWDTIKGRELGAHR